MASSSSSSSTLMKYHVFLSFRGKDTRLSFTTHLLQALKDKGLDVFFDEDKLERGEQLSQELSRAIAVSNMSIILLSEDYASSNSCLAELSDIMDRYRSKQQIVLPIFYQVNPSDVENHDGSFKTSFDQHEATRSVDEVKRWKTAFAEVGKLEGWPIDGSISDRPETQYIKDVVEDVIKKLSNLKSGSASEELVGIDDQKRTILELIKKEDCRVIGLWGMGGQGKTTLADAVYKEISSEFDSSWFLENVREEIEKQGKKSLRNELLSKLLNSNVDIDTPSIGKIFQERLNNRKVLVVLDDISDPNQIDYMGVKHLGSGSKIIITSREKQVLKSGGADTIHEVKALNKDDSLQLFSTFAFKQLNPEVDFRDLSWKFVEYSQGSPLALKVLGCNLYGRTINAWESEMEKLGEYSRPEIFEVLKSSYDRLDKVEKNIFLDIACFFKGEPKKLIKHVLSCYQGVEDGISKLVSKCLINISSSYNGDIISMHDMLEEFGKDIIRQKSKTPRKCRRLWSHEHITRVLKYNQGTDRIQGMKLNTSHMDKQLLSPFVFENMTNLKYIIFYSSLMLLYGNCKKLYTNQVDIVSLPDELKYLRWDGYPCKSLPSNFNPKNLVVLKLLHGDMEQLWDGHPNLPNLREIDGFVNLREIRFFMCVNLRKIPNFSKAINLKILNCSGCESLVELWNEDDDMGLVKLREIRFVGCVNLRKIPNFSRAINLEILDCSWCESLVELWNEDDDMGLVKLRVICFRRCVNLRKIPNFSRAINLEILDCSWCESLVELWNEDDDMGLVKLRHQVFLSFRGEDTRLNFTSHLLKALKDTGMNVFFDEDILEKWDQLSLALSQAIAVANLSIIILSVNYASSKSCLAELSDIMRRKDTQGHIVLPIFYHVDPSDVRNLGGRFKTSFDDHELKNIDQVQQWQAAFAEVGKLKGWHIEGCKFDRPETEYIKDIVDYVIKKLMNSKFESVPEELVGIDDQKKMILRLIDQEDNRIIGLWGMGGIGKTTLADVVYKEASPRFEDHHFLQNVCEKLQKQGMESLRNDFLSKLLNQNICIDTPSIGSTLIQRLNNKRVIVVIDDVNDPDQIDCMVKSLLTSRDRQVLKNGGVDKLHEVKKLNENDSLRLFSTFAFKLLNPSANFRDLSNKFVKYAQGSPLALKVLGSKLYTKPKKDWESEVDKLKEYAQPKITQILKRSFDGLDELEKNIFLDIACFMKWTPKKDVEELLSCYYKGAVCGISNLIDKCLLEITPSQSIYLHDMLEEMGKDIVRQESKSIGMRSRLWDPEDVDKVLRYRKGTQSIEGIVLDMSQIKVELRLHPSTFENMINLKYLHFYSRNSDKKLLVKEHDTDLVNLSCFVLNGCKNLRKIPKLLGAINLVHIECIGCESLVELPCLNHLASLDSLNLDNCCSLKEFPELPNSISALHLTETAIEEVPDSIGHLEMDLHSCFWLESLHLLDLSSCPIAKFPEIPRNLKELCLPRTEIEEVPSCFDCQSSLTLLDLSGTSIKTVDGPSLIKRFENLERLKMNGCESLEFLSNVPLNLGCLEAHGCTSLEKVTFTYQNLFEVPDDVSMIFSNCFHLNQDSIDSIEKTAMIKVRAQIAPNRRIGDRFLAFAICLVADLTNCLHYQDLEFICEYQLKATDGGNEKFKTKWYDNEVRKFESELEDFEFMGDQVLILFHDDMVKKDKDYEEASFEFYIKGRNYRWKEDKDKIDGIEVKKCGVHVFYVDESLSNIVSDEDQSDEMSNNVSDEDKIDETSSDASDEDQLDETSSDASDEDQEMCNFEEMSKDVCSVGEDIPDPIPQRKRRKTKNTYDHEGNEDGSDW
ncbi:disease resistance protein TAO1-like [Gossypium australe]|uniref:Disease resistance protein TAO1-like n=1 Tax=Gossypium australe TaxID=47621 RepID=A0A5B6WM60_9ROSI|nr:disease resistance protein TAO1-like [Gossypium australe]